MSEALPTPLSIDAPQALPVGTRVAEFEVRRLLGSGGFGIVYLAWDHALEREVALKEYMPGTLAGRGSGLQVSVRSGATADSFALGLRSFINEARLLARFDHPSLVKVYRFWEDNGTAYMVMPYYHGRTLRQVRQGMVVPPGEVVCRRVLDGLLSALETLHAEGVFHRDIAPDNILLGDDGVPVLLDFGAARRVLGDRSQALTSIMKPHYAPLEQYADANAMRQGPWTDLYALGGTMYFLISGDEPVAAASRALLDDQPRLSRNHPRDCSPGFAAAVDWMLALKPAERPQSVYMLRDVLEGRITLPGRAAAEITAPGIAALGGDAARGPAGTDFDPTDLARGVAPAAPAPWHAVTVVQTAGGAAAVPTTVPAPAPATEPPLTAPVPVPAPARAAPRRLGLLAALVALNLLAWWWFTRPGPDTLSTPGVAAEPAAPAPRTGPAVLVPVTPGKGAAAADGSSETILSVLPGRAPAARPTASGTAPRPPARESAVASPPATDPAGPRARCGDRNFLSLLICVKRECGQPALQAHPECVKMREQEEAQRSRN